MLDAACTLYARCSVYIMTLLYAIKSVACIFSTLSSYFLLKTVHGNLLYWQNMAIKQFVVDIYLQNTKQFVEKNLEENWLKNDRYYTSNVDTKVQKIWRQKFNYYERLKLPGKSWQWLTFFFLGKGSEEKNSYFLWSFAKPGGGGSARVVKKPYCCFEKVFFQRACRIILGPPKHVLHLVWSPYVIYTAIRTALKEAWEARILGKKGQNPRTKNIFFEWDQM